MLLLLRMGHSKCFREDLLETSVVPAAAVIPASTAYIKVGAVKK